MLSKSLTEVKSSRKQIGDVFYCTWFWCEIGVCFTDCPFVCPSPHLSINICIKHSIQGPVVQSVISLTSSLRVISLTVLADSIYNILIIFVVVVGWCEGAVYLTSLGRPTDIGLQLGKACYPCSG